MKKFIKVYMLLLLFLSNGCEEFVDVGVPKNQLVSEKVFNNDDQASAALTGIYTDMYHTGRNSFRIPFCTGLASDELTNYSNEVGVQQVYQNGLQSQDAITNAFWTNGYHFIYQANAVLEGCEASAELNAGLKKQLIAEARFIRAFWYFYLINFYGDVPLLTITDYTVNAMADRTATSDVYAQIVADLLAAVENLNPEYVDATGLAVSQERVRPNQSAARALLARVYLYTGNWSTAAEMATQVISSNALYDTVAVDEVFTPNNKEAIWQLQNTANSDQSTYEARWFILTDKPVNGETTNCTAISPQLKAAFESGDIRWNAWVGSYTDVSETPSSIYYFPFKYKDVSRTDPSEYSTVLRLSEQYLIRAEARAQLGDLKDALKDLNLIRKRAGLEPKVLNGKSELLDAIFRERQVELFAEWGHRWLDLKRTGEVDGVMEKVALQKGGDTWTSDKQWWPIPQQELHNNPNLTQNPSYD